MKLQIIVLATIFAIATSKPVVEVEQKIEALTSRPAATLNIIPAKHVDAAGPNVKRKARQFFDSTNIGGYQDSGFSAGLGGFSDYSNSGFDISQSQGFGGGGFGGYGGGFGGFGGGYSYYG